MTASPSVASVQPAATADAQAACARVLAEYRQERTYLGRYEAMRAIRDRAANSYMLGVKYQLSSEEAGQLADFAMIAAGMYLKAIYEREVPRRRNRRQRTLSTVVAP